MKSNKPTVGSSKTAEQQIRFAIERIFTAHPDTPTLQALDAALYSAVEDWWGVVAYEMAMTGIRALVTADVATRRGVREWHERRSGTNEPGPLAVLDAARLVDLAAHFYPSREDRLKTKGPEAVAWLRTRLVERFGPAAAVPSAGELEDWISRHAAKRARGKLTTAGIVARIVHAGRLPGASSSPDETLQRVTKVLKRHGYRPLE